MTPFRHDLVSILYTIQGWSESHLAQVEEGKFQTLEGRVLHAEEALARTLKQSFEALAIIRRLALAGKNASTVDSQPVHELASNDFTDVLSVWKKSLESLKNKKAPEDIRVIERIPEGFPRLRCLSAELQEILFHLLTNALQAMKDSGTLIFECRLKYDHETRQVARLSLTDTGSGIPGEILPRIFTPFFTTKPTGQGNGLGLYRVRQLAEKNKGRISVSSFPGAGTTFMLEFPLAEWTASEVSTSFKAA